MAEKREFETIFIRTFPEALAARDKIRRHAQATDAKVGRLYAEALIEYAAKLPN